MKNTMHALLVGLVSVLFVMPKGWGQTPCQVGYLQIFTQEKVDSFPILFPNCKEFIGDFWIMNSNILNLDSLYVIEKMVGGLRVLNTTNLNDLRGLKNLKHGEYIEIRGNENLFSLNGLDNLDYLEVLIISSNNILADISALDRPINGIQGFTVENNPELNICGIHSFCEYYYKNCYPGGTCAMSIKENGVGCTTHEDFLSQCGSKSLHINTHVVDKGDCEISISEIDNPGFGIQINYGEYYLTIPSSLANKIPLFNHQFELITIIPGVIAGELWKYCVDTLIIDPLQFVDTFFADLHLQPIDDCPELIVDLGLPPTFRGCLVPTDIRVRTQNTGTIPAENAQLSVVIPFDLMEVDAAIPPPVTQNGDTLFFTLGDLDVFEVSEVTLTVRTRCDTFLLGQTICIEAIAEMDNPCPPVLPFGSLVQTKATCLGNDTVRFTLTNIGDEPTTTPHHYFIIEDIVVLMSEEFQLGVNESFHVDVDATGSTFRMEATKLPDGTLTSAVLEGCGGLTPGLINAFWLDPGFSHYDIGCRQVTLAYDPNDKMAIPTGVGPEHLLAANRPIEYTIRFQNTGTDTAFRVLLTDILPPELDVNTFRPGYASHDYSWEIRGLDTLEVLFFPITLPDSAVSQEGSQGF
ncbi:MAG: DUF11 domain-containing protein, partial [Saprospiraceae bacterium]|nr:DUF11 domain-containing protein [Saprospiraceae bacterium]